MSDNPQNKAKSTDHVEDKALEKSSTNPETAKESQTDAKGQQELELQRTNKHDGSAGFNDKGDIESVRIETIDEHGNTKVASRKHGGSEKDLLPSSRPAGGFDEVHNADGSVILKGVIPGPGEELENITTGTMEALASENELVKNALEMRKQIDQHMEPGPEKDKVVSQLKADVTASLMSSEISENEIGGTHKAITLESSRNLDTSRDISEKLQESSIISPERMQAVENATAFLVAETARLHGKNKVDALDIDKSDVGRALGTYLLTPDVANAVGEADTRKFGQMLMVFGLAPSFGLADEAQKQITEKTQETVHDGSANFLTGTAFGAILEGHPAVALSIGAVMTTTFFHDQLFSPENKARNEEVLDLYSKTGNSGPEELIAFCDKSKELLGPEAYKASFDLATGGIGIPHGPAASRGIKTEAGISGGFGVKVKAVAESLRKLPDKVKILLNEIIGQQPMLATADGPILDTNLLMTAGRDESNLGKLKSTSSSHLDSTRNGLFNSLDRLGLPDNLNSREKLTNLAELPDFEERSKIIDLLLREKLLDPESPVEVEVALEPLGINQLKIYQEAIQNLASLRGKGNVELPPDHIPQLKKDLHRRLDKLNAAVKNNDRKGIDSAVKEIENGNKAIDFVRVDDVIVLKKGIHDYSMEEVEKQFATNENRMDRFRKFQNVVKILKEAGCEIIYLDGSFITGKDNPKDFDVCWEVFRMKEGNFDPLLFDQSPEASMPRARKYGGDIFSRFGGFGDRVKKWQFDERTEMTKGIIRIDLRRVNID